MPPPPNMRHHQDITAETETRWAHLLRLQDLQVGVSKAAFILHRSFAW